MTHSKAQNNMTLIILTVLFVVVVVSLLSITSVGGKSANNASDHLDKTLSEMSIYHCEDLGDVSYAEFMHALKEINDACNSDNDECGAFDCVKMTLKEDLVYNDHPVECFSITKDVLESYGLGDFNTPCGTRTICENQDNVNAKFSAFRVTYSEYDSSKCQMYFDINSILDTIPILNMIPDFANVLPISCAFDDKYYSPQFMIANGANIHIHAKKEGIMTWIETYVKISGDNDSDYTNCKSPRNLEGIYYEDECYPDGNFRSDGDGYLVTETFDEYCSSICGGDDTDC